MGYLENICTKKCQAGSERKNSSAENLHPDIRVTIKFLTYRESCD